MKKPTLDDLIAKAETLRKFKMNASAEKIEKQIAEMREANANTTTTDTTAQRHSRQER